MDMQYAKAVLAHEAAPRRQLSIAVLSRYATTTKPTGATATGSPDAQVWPRGLACL